MASFTEADKAAESLHAILNGNPWLLSVGVGRNDNNFWVQVAVMEGANTGKAIPLSVDNVPVKVVTRNIPKAL